MLISAAIAAAGLPRHVLDHVRRSGQLLISGEGMSELTTRLARPKFDRYLSQEARRLYLEALASVVEIVMIPGVLRVCRDPDDDKILETAIEGRAHCLVTGDGDLLSLRPVGAQASAVQWAGTLYQTVAIVTPSEFLRLALSDRCDTA